MSLTIYPQLHLIIFASVQVLFLSFMYICLQNILAIQTDVMQFMQLTICSRIHQIYMVKEDLQT